MGVRLKKTGGLWVVVSWFHHVRVGYEDANKSYILNRLLFGVDVRVLVHKSN